MGERGRESAASISVLPTAFEGNRPDAPAELNEDQAAIWNDIVRGEAAGWFNTPALQGMLVDYCRHTATAKLLGKQIDGTSLEGLKGPELKRYETMLKLRTKETSAAAAMATKLRLTNQSRYTPKAAGTASRQSAGIGRKPWET
jgi:hypothetical protein